MEGFKIILLILLAFLGIFLLLSSQQQIIGLFGGVFPSAKEKQETFDNVIFSLDSRNVFNKTQFHSASIANINDIVQIPGGANLFYAIADGSIYYSNDYGANWYPVAIPSGINKSLVFYRLFVNPQKPYEISVLGSEDNKISLYKTTNGFITLDKIYDIDTQTFNKIAGGRSVSIMAPFNDRIIIGTTK